jgi:hypothetical protein
MSFFVITYRNDELLKTCQVVLSLLSIVFLFWAGYLIAKGLNAEQWPDVEAKIIGLEHIRVGGGYQPGVELEYEIDQKVRRVFIKLSTYARSYMSVTDTLANYKVGSHLMIKMNPSDPTDCLYGSKIYYDAALLLIPAATCLVLVWLLHLFSRLPVVPGEA